MSWMYSMHCSINTASPNHANQHVFWLISTHLHSVTFHNYFNQVPILEWAQSVSENDPCKHNISCNNKALKTGCQLKTPHENRAIKKCVYDALRPLLFQFIICISANWNLLNDHKVIATCWHCWEWTSWRSGSSGSIVVIFRRRTLFQNAQFNLMYIVRAQCRFG